ncbi:hypothetical protein Daura_44685 [Dactylosporangium aurantiacum]|uniref:Transmembrane protein n=1 Tax=Dactylosporangium aurantiacum TaxID=35754 RepID=A0A9Q9ICJ6_9ACTN|nr:hypothetical protein [Dactylosporangium aurantiacum]MDG6102122.1 hypothetical protein [Dactylosporangium aurantiacum]UWZ53552.1 hypothetical protein Daura_44685 [Dactylosporangium aurantiacum]
MKLYADRAPTALRQFLTDVFVVVWIYVWIRLGMTLFDLIQKLAAPGRKLEGAGTGLADNLQGAGDKINGVPGVPDSVAAPFTNAANAARSLADAGREQQEIVNDLAWIMSVLVIAVPVALVVLLWLPLRIRWMRRAGSAARLRGATAGRDLLALRALATQPLGRLVKIDPDIAALWRKGDKQAVEALATLELRSLGLR